MKTIDSSLLYSNTRGYFLRAVRRDGLVLGLSDVNRVLTIDDLEYSKRMTLSSIQHSATMDVGNSEVLLLPDEDGVTAADLMRGLWNNFSYTLFEMNWKTPGIKNYIDGGVSGEMSIRDGNYVFELLGLKQYLQNPVGQTTQKTCRARVGDFPEQVPGAKCGVDVATITETGTINIVTSVYVVGDDVGRDEPDDWFAEGVFTFITGPNAGIRRKVRSYAANLFTFDRPFDELPVVGDEYEAVWGCRRRHDRTLANPDGVSDCKDKFDNVRRFQGEAHIPGFDAAYSMGVLGAVK